jgi:5-methyltetrahydrofolate--homocysteine methyltransferase
MLIVGESINSTISAVGEAVKARNAAFIEELARAQVDAGAHMLDVNAGVAGADEVEGLAWLVDIVQKAVDVPLVLDSADPEAIEAALKMHKGRPFINSISGEKQKLDTLVPLIADNACSVIALCLDDKGIPETPEARLEIANLMVNQATAEGISPEDIYIDPLILSLGTGWNAAKVSLDTMKLIRRELPEVCITGGMSNVGFGMPNRRLLNRIFLAMAMVIGLDAAVIDVRDKKLMTVIHASNAILGKDPYCKLYFKAHRAGNLEV